MQYLHSQGVFHADLKPANMLLTGSGTVKLIDFGSSERVAEGARLSSTAGTPAFFPPEVVCGQPYYPFPVDVWALGVSLFMFLYGATRCFLFSSFPSCWQAICSPLRPAFPALCGVQKFHCSDPVFCSPNLTTTSTISMVYDIRFASPRSLQSSMRLAQRPVHGHVSQFRLGATVKSETVSTAVGAMGGRSSASTQWLVRVERNRPSKAVPM